MFMICAFINRSNDRRKEITKIIKEINSKIETTISFFLRVGYPFFMWVSLFILNDIIICFNI